MIDGKLKVELVDQSERIVKQWIKSQNVKGQSIELPVTDIASVIYIVVINGNNASGGSVKW